MKMGVGLKTLLLSLSLILCVHAKTLKVDTVTPSVTNGDFTITPNGTGDVVIGSFSGVLRSSAGVLSTGLVDLTSEISGILPVINGGTGSSTQNFVDLTTNQSVGGDKILTGRVEVSTTTNSSVPAPIMTGAQRDALSSPSSGDQVFNSDTNQLNVYNGSAWVPVGAGGGGLDVYAKEDFEGAVKAADFSCGNNAAFLGGGSLNGTLSDETTSPIAGDTSLKFVMGASSTNDYCASPVILLDEKQKDNFSYVTVYYTYDGDNDDVTFIFWDVANSDDLGDGLNLVKTTTKNQRYATTFRIPSTATALRYGFKVGVGNSGAILKVDDVEFTTKPSFTSTVIQDENTFSARIANNGTATITSQSGENNLGQNAIASVSRTSSGVVDVVFTTGFFTLPPAVVITENDTLTAAAVSTQSISTTGFTVETSNNSGTLLDRDFSIVIIRQGDDYKKVNDAVIVPAKSSSTVTKILTSDVSTVGDIADLTFTGLTPGQVYLMSGYAKGITSSGGITAQFRDQASGAGSVVKTLDFNSLAIHQEGLSTFFTAETSNLYLYVSSASGGAAINGDGTRLETFVQLTNVTSQFLAALPENRVAYVRDVKPLGVSGGTFSNGADRIRDLTEISGPNPEIVSLSANQFTIKPGRYEISWRAPAFFVNSHQSFLYNVTDSAEVKRGESTYADVGGASFSVSAGQATVDIGESKTYEIRHRCAITKTSNGFGVATSFSDEVYTTVRIEGALTNKY